MITDVDMIKRALTDAYMALTSRKLDERLLKERDEEETGGQTVSTV